APRPSYRLRALPRAVDAGDRLAERRELGLTELAAVARRDDRDLAAGIAHRVEAFAIGGERNRIELNVALPDRARREIRGVNDRDPLVSSRVDPIGVRRKERATSDVALRRSRPERRTVRPPRAAPDPRGSLRSTTSGASSSA